MIINNTIYNITFQEALKDRACFSDKIENRILPSPTEFLVKFLLINFSMVSTFLRCIQNQKLNLFDDARGRNFIVAIIRLNFNKVSFYVGIIV